MFLRKFAAAILFAAIALPGIGQNFPTASQLMQPTPHKSASAPQYVVAFGKVIARIDKGGTTKFNYQNGRLISEILPNGVIGTYQYDGAGKFQGIAYNDGKIIKVAYKADGSLSGLTSNSKAKATFKGKYKPAPKTLPLRGFLAVQNGISGILNNQCISDDPEGCAVYVPGFRDPDDEPVSNPGAGPWYDPDSGEGQSGMGNPGGHEPQIYPRTGSAYETVEECQLYVCNDGKENFDKICKLVGKPGADRANCYAKSQEYYSKCLPSCERADWGWLSFFNFIWG